MPATKEQAHRARVALELLQQETPPDSPAAATAIATIADFIRSAERSLPTARAVDDDLARRAAKRAANPAPRAGRHNRPRHST